LMFLEHCKKMNIKLTDEWYWRDIW
jgi:hypothetical protein